MAQHHPDPLPLHAASAEAEHRADLVPVVLRLLVAHARTHAKDPSGLVRGLGFELADLDSPLLRVSYRQCAETIRRAMVLMPSPHLGLEIGEALKVVSLGKVGLGMMASENSHRMFDFLIAFPQSAGCLLSLHSESTAKHFAVVAQPLFHHPELQRFLVGYTLAALASLARQIVGPDGRPISVELALPPPAGTAAYEQAFGRVPAFGRPTHRLVFAPEAQPLPSAEPSVARAMQEGLQAARAAQPVAEVGAAVAQIIRKHQGTPPPLAQVARALNMSERSLRRRLCEEGLSFRGLIADDRRIRTLNLVTQSDASMTQVATRSGYTSARSLRRAVNRWTGDAPAHLRKMAQRPE
jgi:AraC-like DNA-binding protein